MAVQEKIRVKIKSYEHQLADQAAAKIVDIAKTVLEDGRHPEELKDAVCSPGGTTIEGVRALENGAFRAACMEAVRAAYEKTLALGR